MRSLILWLLLVVLAIAGTGAYLIRRPFPVEQGGLHVSGLQASVEVIRDRWGVPHLFAQNDHDLSFAQGYVHAQDRLWQMELNRRTAAGRLSEIFGPVTLDTDRFLRTIGLRRAANL
ncbi:MAG: penicillin acylase family protein, partial [Armatimonadetes bacterium]|nr:penicillin acylase family protein [Armatimonadota bacterium]